MLKHILKRILKDLHPQTLAVASRPSFPPRTGFEVAACAACVAAAEPGHAGECASSMPTGTMLHAWVRPSGASVGADGQPSGAPGGGAGAAASGGVSAPGGTSGGVSAS
eukprot:365488-Chlamydomonas_euryale.AAC.8